MKEVKFDPPKKIGGYASKRSPTLSIIELQSGELQLPQTYLKAMGVNSEDKYLKAYIYGKRLVLEKLKDVNSLRNANISESKPCCQLCGTTENLQTITINGKTQHICDSCILRIKDCF